MQKGIDEKDKLIIDLLKKNGRLSYSHIADSVGLTRPAVKNRIKNLESEGIIEGYRAIVKPCETLEAMHFVVNIEAKAEEFENVKTQLNKYNEVAALIQTTGGCRLLAICVSKDIKSMRTFVNEIYKEVRGIVSINVHTVLDVIKGSLIP